MSEPGEWWVYILECENGALYTGYARDLVKRFHEHQGMKKGARFTRSFKPRRVASAWKIFSSRGNAMRIEHLIKSITREKKIELVDRPEKLAFLVEQTLDIQCRIEAGALSVQEKKTIFMK